MGGSLFGVQVTWISSRGSGHSWNAHLATDPTKTTTSARQADSQYPLQVQCDAGAQGAPSRVVHELAGGTVESGGGFLQ